jgi:hypothetical protein
VLTVGIDLHGMSETTLSGVPQAGCHGAPFTLVFGLPDDLDALRGRMQLRDGCARWLVARVIDYEYGQAMGAEGSAYRPQRRVMVSGGYDGAKLGLHALTNRVRPRS